MNSIAADLLPIQSHELRLGQHTMRYLDEGSGEDVLLCVHGNPTWSYYWRRVIDQFSPQRRVIAIDHLGCGRSDKPSRSEFAYTLEAHCENLVQLIDSLELRKITLIAHDWGGAIGIAAMLRRLDRCARVILLNTAAFPPPYVPLRIVACRTPILGTTAIRGLNLFARSAVRMAMFRNKMSDETAAGLLAPYDNWSHRVAIDSFVRDIPLTARHPTHATLKEIESQLPKLADRPTCLIWGMKDWCFRPECLHRFQAVWPDARRVEISDGGHYVMEDAPEEVLAAIAEEIGERRPA